MKCTVCGDHRWADQDPIGDWWTPDMPAEARACQFCREYVCDLCVEQAKPGWCCKGECAIAFEVVIALDADAHYKMMEQWYDGRV